MKQENAHSLAEKQLPVVACELANCRIDQPRIQLFARGLRLCEVCCVDRVQPGTKRGYREWGPERLAEMFSVSLL